MAARASELHFSRFSWERGMANSNHNANNWRLRLKLRRLEVRRFQDRCDTAVKEAEQKGEAPPDFSKAIRDFRRTRK
jgi:hypothetical protein